MARGKVIDRDRGWKRIHKIAQDGQLLVAVGVQGNGAAEDHGGIDNVRLAGVHEFGAVIDTGRGVVEVPERSFIRSTVDAHDSYRPELRKLAGSVIAGELTSAQALAVLGEKVVSDINKRIEDGIDPPLAESTVERKGSSKPLVDSGQLKGSITYEVRRAGAP